MIYATLVKISLFTYYLIMFCFTISDLYYLSIFCFISYCNKEGIELNFNLKVKCLRRPLLTGVRPRSLCKHGCLEQVGNYYSTLSIVTIRVITLPSELHTYCKLIQDIYRTLYYSFRIGCLLFLEI